MTLLKQKKVLGRGLDSLFPEVQKTIKEESENLINLPLNSIELNPHQPRRSFDDERLAEMAESIKERGVLQPILVRRTSQGYQLVAGERRLRAAKIAGLSSIPCLMVQADDTQSLEIALVENLQRENLNPIEEARGYDELLTRFGLTQEEISGRVGRDRSTVANSLRLLKLPPNIQEDLEVGRISPGHARAILSLDPKPLQAKLWSRIIEKGLSVRQAETMARELKEKTSEKPKAERRPPDILELEEKLMATLGTKVQVKPVSQTSGKIVIHYNKLEDMDRILEILKIEITH